MKISIQVQDFDISTELEIMRRGKPHIGAVVNFLGVVRDLNDDIKVSQMTLEHYPGMTEKSIEQIVKKAQERWNIIDSTIIHRVGELNAGDQIVFVAVASAHRGEAFAACEFIMDYLKTEAPFWKKELTAQGAKWVDARVIDDERLKKWDLKS
jgi:molybdopterin synthase catalytic subunit